MAWRWAQGNQEATFAALPLVDSALKMRIGTALLYNSVPGFDAPEKSITTAWVVYLRSPPQDPLPAHKRSPGMDKTPGD